MAGSLCSEELTAVNDNGSKAVFALVITRRCSVRFLTTFKIVSKIQTSKRNISD